MVDFTLPYGENHPSTYKERELIENIENYIEGKERKKDDSTAENTPQNPPESNPSNSKPDPFTRKSAAEKCNVPFSTWFTAYNYKKFEEGCRDLWPMLSDAERQQAMTHTPEYVKSTPNKQFRKSPLAYLQDKGFNDEIISRTGSDPPKPPPPVSEPITHLKSAKPD